MDRGRLSTYPALEVSFPLPGLGRHRETEPLAYPQEPQLSPSGSLIPTLLPTFSLPDPQGGATGILTWLGSQPWEGTSSKPISISWGDRAQGKNKKEEESGTSKGARQMVRWTEG